MRRLFNTTEMLALAVYRILEMRGTPVPHEAQKKFSAEEVKSWVTGDHYPIRAEMGGSTHPSNGQLMFNRRGVAALAKLGIVVDPEHDMKTYKRDIPEIAKSKRFAAARAENEQIEDNRKKILARPTSADYPSGKRPGSRLHSRGFPRPPEGATYNWKKGRYER